MQQTTVTAGLKAVHIANLNKGTTGADIREHLTEQNSKPKKYWTSLYCHMQGCKNGELS